MGPPTPETAPSFGPDPVATGTSSPRGRSLDAPQGQRADSPFLLDQQRLPHRPPSLRTTLSHPNRPFTRISPTCLGRTHLIQGRVLRQPRSLLVRCTSPTFSPLLSPA